MNSPRIRLSRLTPSPPAPAGVGNGQPPQIRPRRTRPMRPRAGRLHALRAPLPAAGVGLVLLALIGYLAVYAASSNRTAVLLATHTLPAGTILREGDLRTGQIAAEGSVLATLVPGREGQRIVGQRISSTVPADSPLPAAVLAGSQGKTSSLVLSASEYDVTGYQLQPGDRVTVLATFGAGSGQATTRPLARDLEVLAVGEAPTNAQASTATVPVTVAVENPSDASALALANEDAKLDLLLEGTGGSTASIPQATQGSTP
jgi:hypothetical protein